MKSTVTAALAAVAILSLGGCNRHQAGGSGGGSAGGSPIDGTWKADLTTVEVDSKPDVLLLKDGIFSCSTCTPPLKLAADGAFHPVTGQPYADSMSIKANDAHTVTRLSRKGGKETAEATFSVSPDGGTLTISFTDRQTATPVSGSYTETRVGDAPAGAHAISGSWKVDKLNSVSQEGLTVTFKRDGDMLHMTSPVGNSYDAKLDGSDAPVKGDMAGASVSVKQLRDGSYEQTVKRAGKVLAVATLKFGPDGKMHAVNRDLQSGTTVKYDATRS